MGYTDRDGNELLKDWAIHSDHVSWTTRAVMLSLGVRMNKIATSRVQQLACNLNMTSDDFIGEMRKRGCSEPTALKIWLGRYDDFKEFNDNDLYLSNLRKAADVLKVSTGSLFTK